MCAKTSSSGYQPFVLSQVALILDGGNKCVAAVFDIQATVLSCPFEGPAKLQAFFSKSCFASWLKQKAKSAALWTFIGFWGSLIV